MLLIFFIAVALLFCYGLLLQYCLAWWEAIPAPGQIPAGLSPPTFSIVIPARNEAANIAACVRSVCGQDYPAERYEVIVVDDNSDDATAAIVHQLPAGRVRVTCIPAGSAEGSAAPKKRAVATGIAQATGEIIVTTDADCLVPAGWLGSLARFQRTENKNFIAAPVKIISGKSILSKFQALDFLTMQGITGAVVSRRLLNMCNGANLAYNRNLFIAVNGFSGIDHIASGDDMLLMKKVAGSYPGTTGFCKSRAAIVSTQPAATWKAFLQQRIRWASKATHYGQPRIFFVLLLVYCCNLLLFCFLLMGFFYPMAWLLFGMLCLAKFAMEYFFVKTIAAFFDQVFLLPWLLILQPLHVLYIVCSGFLGQVTGYTWKGRKLK
jgi:biofilm PGA synthesis N-glycosyltransferase PgaC